MIILHNKHSKISRDFVVANASGNTVIDWYDDATARNLYLSKYPRPSGFPSLLDPKVGVVFKTTDIVSYNADIFVLRRKQRYWYLIERAVAEKEGGIFFDAIGTSYYYSTKQEDQTILNALVTATTIYADTKVYSLWVSNDPDSKIAWRHIAHTAAQVQAVGQAVVEHILTQSDIFEGLLIQLTNASTMAHLEAITWD